MDFQKYPLNEKYYHLIELGHGSDAVTRAPAVRLNESISLQQDALFEKTIRPIELMLLREK
ncbi:hypothetical protein [Acinetobacter ursingii]|uniref:hypothetical protein n=1 Tax=Acinetobacter ursingii TaxID=108980 RepID=UPI003AF6AE00